jgi:ribosomal protein L37AE/L43A
MNKIQIQNVEEERIDSIFNGICPKCKKTKSDRMNVGNSRECLMCNVVYNLNDKFKEYTKDECIKVFDISNNFGEYSEEKFRTNRVSKEECPNCKKKIIILKNILNRIGEMKEDEKETKIAPSHLVSILLPLLFYYWSYDYFYYSFIITSSI